MRSFEYVGGELEGSSGNAGSQRGDTRAGAIERHHRQLEAVVLLAEEVADGYLGVVEGHRRRVGCPEAHLVLVLVDRHRVVLGDNEGGDAAVSGVLVGLGVDREPVGVAAVGDEALGAVDHVLVAAPNRGRAHARDVRAGVGLGQAEGGELGLFREHPQVLLFDPVRAAKQNRCGGELVGADRRRDRCAAPGQLLADQTGIEIGATHAPVLLGEVGVHQAELPGLFDDLLGPGGVAVIVPGDRPDLLGREVMGHLANVTLLISESEIDHDPLARTQRSPLPRRCVIF